MKKVANDYLIVTFGRRQWIYVKKYGILLMLKEKEWYTDVSSCRQKMGLCIGMMKVDGLESSPEMKRMIEQEKRGEITTEEVRKALDRKYKMER